MQKTQSAKAHSAALRVLKTAQRVALIREMDETIQRSRGAYAGRDEFIAEALRDRIAEERARGEGSTGPAPVLLLASANQAPSGLTLGKWADGAVPTLPSLPSNESLYGLHNRDFPTLWAIDHLARWAAEGGRPMPWNEFVTRVVESTWAVAAHLLLVDRERSRGEQKSAIGFPTNPEKRASAEARFLEHMLGVIREDRARGPLFVLGLVGIERDGREVRVAPTGGAITLLRALATAGIRPRPPHPEPAWTAFRKHLAEHAAPELRTWMRVVKAAIEAPDRVSVLQAFAIEWPGSAAESNVYGYLSRAREWGLLEPQLAEGRYRVTPRGSAALGEKLG